MNHDRLTEMKPVDRIFLFILIFIDYVICERCPPFFGEFECPKGFNCVLGVCKNSKNETPPTDCSKINCEIDSKCFNGKCLPIEGLPCGRNVLTGENTARSIVSDCGWRGKCINGHCSIDKCFEKLCNDDEICRDGTCTKILGSFCWSNFDCGKQRRCQGNQCVNDPDAVIDSLSGPGCDPGEIYRDHKCQKNEGCSNIVCDIGETCVDGICIPIAIDCKTERCPKGMICQQGLCAVDPCVQKGCPPDHVCLLGECRLIQGMICQESCPEPFLCHNGLCVKNECRRKACQIGEYCENGICVRIEGKFCTLSPRDCGEAFECVNGQCKDTITVVTKDHRDPQRIPDKEPGDDKCSARCHRLLSRSLSKVNYSIKKVNVLLKSNQKIKDFGDVCWKFYDYYDCQKQCKKRPKRSLSRLDVLTRLVVKRCKFVDENYNNDIKCIHRYHSFIEIRCLSYMNEAVRLRKLISRAENDRDKNGGIQETCRFLHYHNMCLSNTVFFYCPNAKKLFNRFTLRNYFLSFVIPDDDEDFSDKFLDYCEVFDFQKMAKAIYDTTSSIKIEDLEDFKSTTSFPMVKLLNEDQVKIGITSKEKKVFASDEDLQDNPPNFFYSSARYETTTYRPVATSKDKIQSNSSRIHPSGQFWSPKPVTIEFVSHAVESSPEPTAFTLDPNHILSTIFKFPKILPTTVIDPDPTTIQTDNTGDVLDVKPESKEDEFEADSGDSSSGSLFEDDEEVIWKTRPSAKTTTKVPGKKIEDGKIEKNKQDISGEISEEKTKIEEKQESEPKTVILDEIPIETTTADRQVEHAELKKKIPVVNVSLTITNSAESSEESRLPSDSAEILPNTSPDFPKLNSTEKLVEISEEIQSHEIEETSTLAVSSYSEPALNSSERKTTVSFELPVNRKPLLSGTKVHIKRIRHYSELANDKDPSEEEEEDGPQGIQTIPKHPSQSSELPSSDPKAFWNSIIRSEEEYDQSNSNETVDPRVDSTLLDHFNEDFADLTTLKWFLILYCVIFILAFTVLLYLIVSIISKKCKKRRKYSFSN